MKRNDFILVAVSVILSVGVMQCVQWYNSDPSVHQSPTAQFINVDPAQRPMAVTASVPANFVNASSIGRPAVVRISTMHSGFDFWNRPTDFIHAEGSGVLISPDGYIVTNNHVISKGSKFKIETIDHKTYAATLIGSDPTTDLAVLKIDAVNMPWVYMANSDSVQIGQYVIAIGNPYHLSSTVTTGIVSAKGRTIDLLRGTYSLESFIQTDAVVNSGNSGGALLNEKGHLIGINTAIFTQSGRFEGYSFAIPSNIVRKMVSDIIDYGKVQRGILGIGIENMTPRLAKEKGIVSESGVLVNRVAEGSAGQLAGIRTGDVIIAFNNKPIINHPQLQEEVALHRPGDKVKLQILRQNKTHHVTVRLASPIQVNTSVTVRADKPLKDLGFELRDMEGMEKYESGHNGVIVHSIFKGSQVASTTMEPGFIIQKINGTTINSVDEAIRILNKAKNQVALTGVYKNFPDPFTYNMARNTIGL